MTGWDALDGVRYRGSLIARSGFASIVEAAPFAIASRGADVFEQRLRGIELGSSDSPAGLPIRGDIDMALSCRFSWLRPNVATYRGHPSSFFGLQAYIWFDC